MKIAHIGGEIRRRFRGLPSFVAIGLGATGGGSVATAVGCLKQGGSHHGPVPWAVLRRVDKAGRVGPGPITPQGVFETVVSYARKAGLGRITPHDLRRTIAKLAHLGRVPLEQIQISLGHASIQTTERYLGLRQNLHDAPCDRLGLVGWEG